MKNDLFCIISFNIPLSNNYSNFYRKSNVSCLLTLYIVIYTLGS